MKKSKKRPVIHLLDEDSVNRIAAGEVVERPASVVKEIVENSIDADAKEIVVEITTNKSQVIAIKVTDDGIGMKTGDLKPAFMPHATSKIKSSDELLTCGTLGFRGEALASIAAVSYVTLVTRPDDGSLTGSRIIISGGEILEVSEAGTPVGTLIKIEQLFFNTPARRKFLKSLSTELSRIADIIEGFCILYPEITFRYILNKNERLSTHGCLTLGEVLGSLRPSEIEEMVPVSSENEGIKINGFISVPSLSRSSVQRIVLSVNNRRISSSKLNTAIKSGYGTLLPPRQYPVAVLFISADSNEVDANVHPTKREVRFSDEKKVILAVEKAVNETLYEYNLVPVPKAEPEPVTLPLINEEELAKTPKQEINYKHPESCSDVAGVRETTHAGLSLSAKRLRQSMLPVESAAPPNKNIPKLSFVGQIDAMYIIAATDEGGMVIIDQHAAHERVRYDQILSAESGKFKSQELIVPVVFPLGARESDVIHDIMPVLEDEGFVIEPFGKDTCLVRAVPVFLGRCEDAEVLHDILEAAVAGGQRKPERMKDVVSKMVACRGAIKAGTVLSDEQYEELLDQLIRTDNPYTCPHGRPTMISFSPGKLSAMFKRT